jgi:hypothetical protein
MRKCYLCRGEALLCSPRASTISRMISSTSSSRRDDGGCGCDRRIGRRIAGSRDRGMQPSDAGWGEIGTLATARDATRGWPPFRISRDAPNNNIHYNELKNMSRGPVVIITPCYCTYDQQGTRRRRASPMVDKCFFDVYRHPIFWPKRTVVQTMFLALRGHVAGWPPGGRYAAARQPRLGSLVRVRACGRAGDVSSTGCMIG